MIKTKDHFIKPNSYKLVDKCLTFKDVLELVLLEAGAHGFLDGTDVLIEPDNKGVIVHALHVGNDGIVPLFSQWDQVVEAMNSARQKRVLQHNANIKISMGVTQKWF